MSWSTALRQTFRLLPEPSGSLRVFLEADGLTPEEILAQLPYDRTRAGDGANALPNPKRYRDNRQVFRSVGLVYEDGGRLHVTPLGEATLWWIDRLTPSNVAVLGAHAAFALSGWQLRNPTREGQGYDDTYTVFPYQTIWRVMLRTDFRITSDEMARAVLKIRSEDDIVPASDAIIAARKQGDPSALGERVHQDNDRIIPWMSLASFGWTLFHDKVTGDHAGSYEIPLATRAILARAARIQWRHRDFLSEGEYLRYIASLAGLKGS